MGVDSKSTGVECIHPTAEMNSSLTIPHLSKGKEVQKHYVPDQEIESLVIGTMICSEIPD